MFKVIWDKENNGVRLTMAPPSGEALNVCPRPVFWEELDFLGLNRIGWKYLIVRNHFYGLVTVAISTKVNLYWKRLVEIYLIRPR